MDISNNYFQSKIVRNMILSNEWEKILEYRRFDKTIIVRLDKARRYWSR